MKSKNGFTLIELLAVIIILAIIMIIAVPKILEVIEHADMMAYKDSVELMIHQAKMQYQTNEIKGQAKTLPIVYNYEYDEIKKEGRQKLTDVEILNFKGDKPREGSITLTEVKKVKVEKLVSKNNKWCAIKEENGQLKVGRSTDASFNCVQVQEEIISDKIPCELEESEETIDGGSKRKIYYVDSESDLYKLSLRVSGRDGQTAKSYSNEKIVLRNNLDMSKYTTEEIQTQCNNTTITGFEPIGNSSHPFSGIFEGNAKIISNLTIDMTTPTPNQTASGFSNNYVGLFGYINSSEGNNAQINGLLVNNIVSSGNNYVGGVIGYIGYYSIVRDIIANNINVSGNNFLGGIFGSNSSSNTYNFILRTGTINSTGTSWDSYRYGYIGDQYSAVAKNAIVESVVITGNIDPHSNYRSSFYDHYDTYYNAVYVSENSSYNGKKDDVFFSKNSINDINFYEGAGLDTYIGGDNDNDGYYFDYDNNGIVTLFKTSDNTFNLSLEKDGDYYLIKNESDWKKATSHLSNNYKITNDLDFSNNKYYMMGSYNNPFMGVMNGNSKEIKNIKINADKANYIGPFGYINNATIYAMNLKNIEINAHSNVGGFSGYETGNIYSITIDNIKIRAKSYVGGFTGQSYLSLNEILVDNFDIYTTGKIAGGIVGNVGNGVSDIQNVLLKSGTLYNGGTDNNDAYRYGYFATEYQTGIKSAIAENAILTGQMDPRYKTAKYNSSNSSYTGKFISNNSTYNGKVDDDFFDSQYIDDISYYSEKIETSINGDNNNTGYFFDNDPSHDGKIWLVKAYDKTNITSNLNPKESSTLIYDVNPGDSDNSPTCTFTKMIIFNNGFKPEVHCDDDVGLASFKSFFAYENDAQAQYEDIGNTKTTTISWSNNNKTITYNGVWRETNATGPWPSKGQCYYFRYGAMDTSGNYCTYVTQNCYSY